MYIILSLVVVLGMVFYILFKKYRKFFIRLSSENLNSKSTKNEYEIKTELKKLSQNKVKSD